MAFQQRSGRSGVNQGGSGNVNLILGVGSPQAAPPGDEPGTTIRHGRLIAAGTIVASLGAVVLGHALEGPGDPAALITIVETDDGGDSSDPEATSPAAVPTDVGREELVIRFIIESLTPDPAPLPLPVVADSTCPPSQAVRDGDNDGHGNNGNGHDDESEDGPSNQNGHQETNDDSGQDRGETDSSADVTDGDGDERGPNRRPQSA